MIRAREWRNYVYHPEDIVDQQTFDKKWLEGTKIIHDLGYHDYDTNQLKTISLDPKHELVLKSLNSYIAQLTRNLNALKNKVSNVENKVSNVENKVSNVENKVANVENKVANVENDKNGNSAAITILEQHVNAIAKEVRNLASEQTENKTSENPSSGTHFY